jgi:hypothetical protein
MDRGTFAVRAREGDVGMFPIPVGGAGSGALLTVAVGAGSGTPTVSIALLVVLPRPLLTFVKATAGPYCPRSKCCAEGLTVSVMVTPLASADPKIGFAVSHDGVLIEYRTL